MNRIDLENDNYLISFELKTNIAVPNKGSLPMAIADGLNGLYQVIDSKFVDVKTMTIDLIRDSFEDKVNVVVDEDAEDLEEEKESDFIA